MTNYIPCGLRGVMIGVTMGKMGDGLGRRLGVGWDGDFMKDVYGICSKEVMVDLSWELYRIVESRWRRFGRRSGCVVDGPGMEGILVKREGSWIDRDADSGKRGWTIVFA